MSASDQDTTKRCRKCGEVKEREDFYLQRRALDGRQSYCKPCHQKSVGKWFEDNSERNSKTSKEWAKNNVERRRKVQKQWQKANRDYVRDRRKQHRIDHPEANRETCRKWVANNPEKVKASRRRSSRKVRRDPAHRQRLQARQEITEAIRTGTITRGPCAECGLPPKKIGRQNRIHAHHHLGYAPEHWLDIIWLCKPCHVKAERLVAPLLALAAADERADVG